MVSSQLWPPVVDPSTLTRQVWDVETARSLPGMGRALQLYGGLIAQCALDQYAGDEVIKPRPPLLALPDVHLRARSTFVRVHVEDYLLHGNAVHLVTARYADGSVRGVRWFPAHMWHVTDPAVTEDGGVDYYLNGRKVERRQDVVHVQRGAAEGAPWRGVGVVEEHLKTLNRAGLEEAAESKNLTGGGVPSVAVIAPNPTLTKGQAEEAKDTWEEKFEGPGRRPAILPNGTQVVPLGWSPVDGQMIEARKMSLVDVANCCNLDPYWLGGQSSSHTYKSPGPMFLTLTRTSLEPVMSDLELVWSLAWLPYGRSVRFDRLQLTRDDFATEVQTGVAGVAAGLITAEEWRIRQGLPTEPEFGQLRKPGPAVPAGPPGPPALTVLPGGGNDDQEGAA
ncbi:phage portal protein [Micromonospora aurantiaca (nom. illeg.)]|uniref:phage portal protein n=1 Tax=Micromonospora aurantiaca (nom. illeg.) TaxID=47850 RepID=UPI003F49D942